MFRKSPVARQEWAPELLEGCAVRQISILVEAARTVRPGGFLVYSTCTFAPEENEGTVARFLDGHRDFELVEPVRWVGMSPGRPDWLAARFRRPDSWLTLAQRASAMSCACSAASLRRRTRHVGAAFRLTATSSIRAR